MKNKKDLVHILLCAVAVLIVTPLFFTFVFPSGGTNGNDEISATQSSAVEIFHDDIQIPSGTIEIKSADLSGTDFKNETKYSVNESKIEFTPINIDKDKPSVLIIHTYGTQAYAEKNYIQSSSTLKSLDNKLNVICAGEALSQRLEEKGLKVIHDKTLYDEISYSRAYELSIKAARDYIKQYPSIKYIIDIQRDSVFSQSGSCIRSIANVDGEETAQILFIAGSDENGADFPTWTTNLSLSMSLSKEIKKTTPKLTRGVNLMPSGYGQYVCDGFITVEIGTSGNTPLQAQKAAVVLADAFYNAVVE